MSSSRRNEPRRDDTRRDFSRRDFIRTVGAVAGAISAGQLGVDLLDPQRAAALAGPTLPVGTPVLVLLELAGGNDALNTVIPIDVPGVTNWYLAARPSLGVKTMVGAQPFVLPAPGVYLPPALDIGGGWGLHGALPYLANRWWARGDVAIVQGYGEDVVQEMSHFAAFAYRWAGAFSGPNLSTGWLGRYHDVMGAITPLGSISIGASNRALAGVTSSGLAINDLSSFNWVGGSVPSRASWDLARSGLGSASIPPEYHKVAVAGAALARAEEAVGSLRALGLPSASFGPSLAGQLAQVAALIGAGVPCQTYTVTLGTFDTHGNQPYNHAERLLVVDDALTRFFAAIDAGPRAADVFVMIHSEFGRQVGENAGAGTDHGRASSAILVGGGVQGGLHGQFPDLSPGARDADAMVPTTDVRSVYSTVLARLAGDQQIADAAMADGSAASTTNLGLFTGAGA